MLWIAFFASTDPILGTRARWKRSGFTHLSTLLCAQDQQESGLEQKMGEERHAIIQIQLCVNKNARHVTNESMGADTGS